MIIKMVPVSSTNLKEVGYEPLTQTLRVRFHAGNALYDLTGVPVQVHDDLMRAPDMGTYYNLHIRNKGFKTERLRGNP